MSLKSVFVPTAAGSGSQKLGHPVPLSYLRELSNSGW
jgi:hypothetical protein